MDVVEDYDDWVEKVVEDWKKVITLTPSAILWAPPVVLLSGIDWSSSFSYKKDES